MGVCVGGGGWRGGTVKSVLWVQDAMKGVTIEEEDGG
jgi:hypothetical protein